MAFTNKSAFSFHLYYQDFDLNAVSECRRQPALMSVRVNNLDMKIKLFSSVEHVNS